MIWTPSTLPARLARGCGLRHSRKGRHILKRFHAVVVILALGAIAAASALAASGSTPNHDYTEARAAGADSGYAVVVLKDPPAASYTGGIRGLGATKPGKGQKLDPNGQAVRAYTNHLRSAHTSVKGWLASNAPNAQVVREYYLTANAIAVKLNGTSKEALLRAPDVVKVTGSWTYHTAILARSIHVPAVAGLHGASVTIQAVEYAPGTPGNGLWHHLIVPGTVKDVVLTPAARR